jgi:hypothetical protein
MNEPSPNSTLERRPDPTGRRLLRNVNRAIDANPPDRCLAHLKAESGRTRTPAQEVEWIRALDCALTGVPGLRAIVKPGRQEWQELRLEAVRLLGASSWPDSAAMVLGQALFYPDAAVRDLAASTLLGMGDAGTGAICRSGIAPVTWDAESLASYIDLLRRVPADRSAPTLCEISREQCPDLLSVWALPRFRRIFQRLRSIVYWVGFTVALAGVLFGSPSEPDPEWLLLVPVWALCVALPPLLAFCISAYALMFWPDVALRLTRKRARRRLSRVATEMLAKSGNMRALKLLLEHGAGIGSAAKSNYLSALDRLLPAVRSSNDVRLSAVCRQNLASLLRIPDPDFKLKVLRALGHLGGEPEVSHVERHAKHGRTEAIRLEAAQAMERIKARLLEMQNPKTLLRASRAPSTANEELLRPTGETPESHPDELLRAGFGEQPD